MEVFEKNLRDYIINAKETAVLLNGNWGLGKTYYIEHSLQGIIKQYEVIYTSINGIDNIEMIERQILFRIMAAKNKLFSNAKGIINLASDFELNGIKANKMISSIIKSNRILKRIRDKKTLIVVDDIERLSSKIDIEDFLGFLLQKLVHNNFKVLLVGNENEIKERDQYFKVKEKYVLHTVAYRPKFRNQIESITEQRLSQSNCKSFCKKYVNNAELILSEAEHKNIRTYIHFLDLFRLPFKILIELEAEEFIVKSVYEELLATLVEYKKGSFNDSLNIEKFNSLSLYSLGQFKDDNYYNSIYELYIQKLDMHFVVLHSIHDFVIKGIWNEGHFKSEITKSFSESHHKEYKIKRDEKDVLQKKILNYKQLEFPELKVAFNKFLKYIANGDYAFQRYPYFLSLLYTILDIDYGLEVDRVELHSIFLTGLKKAIAMIKRIDNNEVRVATTHLYNDKYSDDSVIKELIIRIKSVQVEDQLSIDQMETFSKLINNEINELERLEIIRIDRIKLILSLASPDNQEFFNTLTNQGIHWLEVLLKDVFQNYSRYILMDNNIENIIKIITNIEKVTEDNDLDKMKLKRMNELKRLMKNGLSKYSKT